MKKIIDDIKHILWLSKLGLISFINGDINGVRESWLLIKMHWNYSSTKINIPIKEDIL